ncbi:MAG TPA: hypothetical protein VFI29_21765 [Hanamia sp.]|nr:hypothetical protein [Hanamia sp.]
MREMEGGEERAGVQHGSEAYPAITRPEGACPTKKINKKSTS